MHVPGFRRVLITDVKIKPGPATPYGPSTVPSLAVHPRLLARAGLGSLDIPNPTWGWSTTEGSARP